MKRRISITVERDIMNEIDRRRGDINRSVFVETLIKAGLGFEARKYAIIRDIVREENARTLENFLSSPFARAVKGSI